MTLAEKYLEIFGQEYNDTDPEILNIRIKEMQEKPWQISPALDRSWYIDCLHDHFQRETVGIRIYQHYFTNSMEIRFEDDLYDTLEELKEHYLAIQTNKW